MREITTEELKKIELDILLDIAKFCDENNLRYYLAGGTLLGAIRHKGFIPWDDDIDIIMPRKDYLKFINIYNEKKDQYRVYGALVNKNWYSAFAQVENTETIKIYTGFDIPDNNGVNVDIFITDGAPDNFIVRKIYWCFMNFLGRVLTLSYQKFKLSKHYDDQDVQHSSFKKYIRTGIKFLAIPIARMTRIVDLAMIMSHIAKHFEVDDSKFIGVCTFPHYGYKECVRAEEYLKIRKRKFEGYMLNTPDNYEEYLENLYGDYMKMPPKEKQVSHHDFVAYWKEDNRK